MNLQNKPCRNFIVSNNLTLAEQTLCFSPAGWHLCANYPLSQSTNRRFKKSAAPGPCLWSLRQRPGHGVLSWEEAASWSRLGSSLLPHQVIYHVKLTLRSREKVEISSLDLCVELNLCPLHLPPRGGGERGLAWQRQARVEGKQRGVEDLRACLYLISSGVSSPSLTALTACSAGAVPVGALCNTHPHMMRAVALQVKVCLSVHVF